MVKKFDDVFSYFDTIPSCDRRTDRHLAAVPYSPHYAYTCRSRNKNLDIRTLLETSVSVAVFLGVVISNNRPAVTHVAPETYK